MKKTLAAMLAMILLFAAAFIAAQANAGALLTQARAMKAAGDLQGAMVGLERVVSEFSADRNAAANALLEMGAITEQLGQINRARSFYERVKSQFQDQTVEVRTAESRLAAAGTNAGNSGTAPSNPTSKVTVKTPNTDDPFSFAISPDGKTLVVQVTTKDGKRQLWRVPVDGTSKGEPIAGTDGAGVNSFPFFSPDGRSIGYFANQKLWRIDLAGGKPTELANAQTPAGGSWGKNDVIIFSAAGYGTPLQKIQDGRVSSVTVTGALVMPSFLNDDRFLYFARNGPGGRLEVSSISQSAPAAAILGIVPAGGAQSVAPARGARGNAPGAQAGTFTSGYLVYMVDGRLMAQKFDPQTVTLSGASIPLTDRVGREARFPGLGTFTASLGGAIAYREDSSVARQFKWIDRAGKPVGNPGPFDSASPQAPRVSPDGRSIVFYRQTGTAVGSVWVMDAETGATRTLRDPAHRAVWSPDGKSMVFATLNNTGVGPVLFEQPLPSGTGRFLLPGVQAFPSDISVNGAVLYTAANTAGDVMLIPPGGTAAVPVVNSPAAERGARFSPNGQWIAYQSDESGRPEIYVQPVSGGTAQRQRVSFNGGINPEWDPKRQAIYFLSPDYHLMMAAAEATSDNKSIEFGTPKALFERPLTPGAEYSPAPDGERFFLVEPGEDAPPIVVLSNWAR